MKRLRQRYMKLEKQIRPLRLLRRYFTRYNADVFLVSFPKSGRTWVRFVLGDIIQRHYGIAEDKILVLSGDLMKLAGGKIRLKTTHDLGARYDRGYSGMSKEGYRGKKVILLSRDIRDTLVSYYYHVSKRNQEFEGTLGEFIRSDIFGAEKILRFYGSWAKGKHLPAEFLLVRYEDLQEDMYPAVRGMLKLIGVEGVSDEIIRNAIEKGQFDNMQQVEKNRESSFQGLNAPNTDANAVRVRRGKVGGFRDELTPDDLVYIEKKRAEIGVPAEWVYYTEGESQWKR
jgi:hypothetical protein